MPSQGLKASAGYNHAISDFLMTPHRTCLSAPTWLLQCLRYQHGSCFLHPCCSSVLLSRRATRPHRPVPHSVWLWRETFLYSHKTHEISLYQDAGGFGSDVFSTLFPCRGRWSFVMTHGHLIGCRLLSACAWHFLFFLFFLFLPHHPNWKRVDDILCKTHCFYVHAYWKYTTVYMHFSCKWSGSFFIVRKG